MPKIKFCLFAIAYRPKNWRLLSNVYGAKSTQFLLPCCWTFLFIFLSIQNRSNTESGHNIDLLQSSSPMWPFKSLCGEREETFSRKHSNEILETIVLDSNIVFGVRMFFKGTPKRIILQTLKTKMKCRIMWHFTRVYTALD